MNQTRQIDHHNMLKLPRNSTDAEPYDRIKDDAQDGWRIDHNPTFWKIQLAQRWVAHVEMNEHGDKYDLDEAFMFERLPRYYVWLAREVEDESGVNTTKKYEYGVMAYMFMGGKYGVRIWMSVEQFWPHFVWLMETKEGACWCAHCGPENDLDGDVYEDEEEDEAKGDEDDTDAADTGASSPRSGASRRSTTTSTVVSYDSVFK